ncbi:MAG: ribbon-helix-helix protein, CopG family [Acidimicrobiales bacterium]
MIPTHRAALDALAARRGCSVSELLREAVAALLAAEEPLSA